MELIRQPRVVGEMIAGVLLGPTLLGAIFPEFSNQIFLPEVKRTLFILGNLGLSLYMFLVGAQIDYKLFTPVTVKRSMIVSVSGTIVPFAFGVISGIMYFTRLVPENVSLFSCCFFMGTALAITAFPMLARILQAENIVNTSIGVISLLGASIQDVISWILLAFVTSQAQGKGPESGFITLIGALVFAIVVWFIARPYFKRMGEKSEKSGVLSQNGFAMVIICLISAALITDELGLYSVFGGFILGLVMPRTKVFQTAIQDKLYDFNVVFLLPLFFTFSGLNTNLISIFDPSLIDATLVILLFSFIGKYVAVGLAMKATGYTWRQSSAIGGLINARGLMELIIANIGLQYKIIKPTTFSILVLIAVLSTLLAMPIYRASKPEPDLA